MPAKLRRRAGQVAGPGRQAELIWGGDGHRAHGGVMICGGRLHVQRSARAATDRVRAYGALRPWRGGCTIRSLIARAIVESPATFMR